MSTIFTKVINKEIPAKIVYEDELCLAFHDINPVAPCHVLLIPKKEMAKLSAAELIDQDLLGYMMLKASEVAKLVGYEDFRVVINNGAKAQQTVFHLHLHIIAGRSLNWPPG